MLGIIDDGASHVHAQAAGSGDRRLGMGASAWVYFTPHHPKPSAALRALREQVFAAGQYRKPATVQERLAQLGPASPPGQGSIPPPLSKRSPTRRPN